MSDTPLSLYREKLSNNVLQPDERQLEAAVVLEKLYNELVMRPKGVLRFLKRQKPPKGLYLYGGVGRGKSMLMDMFYDCLPNHIAARRVHFHAFMIEVHDFLHKARSGENQENSTEAALIKLAGKIVGEGRVLCFDEFHVTDIADAMILGRLFTALFDKGAVVVATSNWPPDKLYQGGLQRDLFLPFIETLKAHTRPVAVDGGTDYRLQCLSDSGVYFCPAGRHAAEQADAVFAKLTDGAAPYTETLTVKGRDLTVSAVARGVARFTFSELCEMPLGAEDYLMVAKNYHTVFVENIPVLGEGRRNEAKRLITLIDALYESGTKLVVTADAMPDKLHQGQDHAFEFERTASRLIEMQGEKYLAGKDS